MAIFLEYDWPGNVRELKNTVERIVLMHDNEKLSSALFLSLLKMTALKTRLLFAHK